MEQAIVVGLIRSCFLTLVALGSLLTPGLALANEVVDGRVVVEFGQPRWDRRTGISSFVATIRNTTSEDLSAPFWLGIADLQPGGLAVVNASGITPSGYPYVDLSSSLGQGGRLQPNQQVEGLLQLLNPGRVHATFVAHVWAVPVPSEPLVVMASADLRSGEAPLAVNLSAQVSGGVVTLYEWDFEGDGVFDYQSASSPAVTHLYTEGSVYSPRIRVSNAQQNAESFVVIDVVPPLEVTVRAAVTEGTVPLTVHFSAVVNAPVELYEWDFDGDGSFDRVDPFAGSPSHTYEAPGTYLAHARVTNQYRSSTDDLEVEVTPLPPPPPSAPVIPKGYPTVTNHPSVSISGYAGGADQIEVSSPLGVSVHPAPGGAFTVSVDLHLNRLNHLVFTGLATGADRGASTAIQVTQDSRPPLVYIDYPPDGAEIFAEATDVTGRVSDALSGFNGLAVTVNGEPADVDIGIGTNGTFFLPGLALPEQGDLEILVVATDLLGNANSTLVTVHRGVFPAGEPRLDVVSGANQPAQAIHTEMPEPLVVEVTDGQGTALPDQRVVFTVVRSDGQVYATASDAGGLTFETLTDSNGRAAALWTLGGDAGQGNNRVSVSADGAVGTVLFCASALAGPVAQVNIGTGNNQRVEAGGPLQEPLRAWVSDGCNGVEDVPVAFTVTRGSGKLNGGATTITINTGPTGHAAVDFVTGAEPGANEVQATIGGGPGRTAVFLATGVPRDPSQPTRLDGVVFDNAIGAIGGAPCELIQGSQVVSTTTTDLEGLFHFVDVPAGQSRVRVDGQNATHLRGVSIPPRSFPTLSYDVLLIPNAENKLPMPVLLPPLNPANERIYYDDPNTQTTVECEGIAGLKMIIQGGSMTQPNGIPYPDGTIVSLNQVHHDDVPMPMPDGAAPPFAWTLQPGGAHFDPPVQIVYPNMSGLPPGAVAYFLSFDHDTNKFEIVASGTVTPDGSEIHTDPGAGISESGWGCNCPPYSVTEDCEKCEEGDGFAAEDEECDPCKEELEKLRDAAEQGEGTGGQVLARQLLCLAEKTCGDDPYDCPGNPDWNQGFVRDVIEEWTSNLGNNFFQNFCEQLPEQILDLPDCCGYEFSLTTRKACALLAGFGYHFPAELVPGFWKACKNGTLDDDDHNCLVNGVIPECFDEIKPDIIANAVAKALVPIAAVALREGMQAICDKVPFRDEGNPAPRAFGADEIFVMERIPLLDEVGSMVLDPGADYILHPGDDVPLEVILVDDAGVSIDVTATATGTYYLVGPPEEVVTIDESGVLHVHKSILPNPNMVMSFQIAAVHDDKVVFGQFAIEDFDLDLDLMNDSFEAAVGLDPAVADGDPDYDDDGLSNRDEVYLGTDPFVPDTDEDGDGDGFEVAFRSDPGRNGSGVQRPGANLVLQAGNQSGQAGRDGSFRISNISAADLTGPTGRPDFVADEPIMISGSHESFGRSYYTASQPFFLSGIGPNVVETLQFSDQAPQVVQKISIRNADHSIMTGETGVPLMVVGTLGDGSEVDLSGGSNFTQYRSSNSQILAVDDHGVLVPQSQGVAFVRASYLGATAVAQFVVVDPNASTTVIGRTVDLFGTPVAGATVRLTGLPFQQETGADGRFEFDGVPTNGEETLLVRARLTSSGMVLAGEAEVVLLPGGTSDAGDLVLAPLSGGFGLIADNGTARVIRFDTLTDETTGAVPISGFLLDCEISSDGRLGFVSDFERYVWAIDLTTDPPSLAAGTNPIPVSCAAEDLVLTADDRYLLVTDGSGSDPVCVVNVEGRQEVAVSASQGWNAVSVCSDGTVLLASHANGQIAAHRLELDGSLVDLGLVLPVESPITLACAPTGGFGACADFYGDRVLIFDLETFAIVSERTVDGNALAVKFDGTGNRVITRASPGKGSHDTIEVWGFDAISGQLSDLPQYAISVGTATAYYGIEHLAIDELDDQLYVPHEGQVSVFDLATGAEVGVVTGEPMSNPVSVSMQLEEETLAGHADAGESIRLEWPDLGSVSTSIAQGGAVLTGRWRGLEEHLRPCNPDSTLRAVGSLKLEKSSNVGALFCGAEHDDQAFREPWTYRLFAEGHGLTSPIVEDCVPIAREMERGTLVVYERFHPAGAGQTSGQLRTRLIGVAPNPFASSTILQYETAHAGRVLVDIVDVQGRSCATLVDQVRQAGRHVYRWAPDEQGEAALPAGVYFVRLRADGAQATRRLLLIR